MSSGVLQPELFHPGGAPLSVGIVGGGVAGLATAYEIHKLAAASNLAVRAAVYERAATPGGKVRSLREDGFVIEGGPDSLLTEKPWGVELCRDLGLGDELLPSNDAQRLFFILRNGKLHPFPAGMRLFIPQSLKPLILTRLLSPMGKLRMAFEPFVPARREGGDESLAAFVTRRCGREVLDRLAGPLLAGIYAADPDQMSMRSTFPSLLAMEQKHGSLTKAIRVAMKRPATPGRTLFTSLRGGMESLIDALRARLDGHITTGSAVRGIRIKAGRYELVFDGGRVEAHDAVVLACSSAESARLLAPFNPTLSADLARQEFTSSITVSLGYRRADLPYGRAPRGFGFLTPASENRRVLGGTWSTNKFNHRSDEDHFLIRLFISGPPADEWMGLDDAALAEVARAELRDIADIDAQPMMHRVFRWPNANPQYRVGHGDWISGLESTLARIPGLHITGSCYYGASVSDCAKSSRETAARVLTGLTARA
jgi:oxygen-dependent protoporphyrinogen oxidase